ncbi:unnamed protein product [Prorocentrum cordatum]|uniref:Fringe-like glycosyltransferase domain-containing protein n=1 Tax=Prorocentrum cordatum TaxID=2364126 RepID=A0ABN9TCI6_9DINO|nr:unnamed protein product [Polarella glacialis]
MAVPRGLLLPAALLASCAALHHGAPPGQDGQRLLGGGRHAASASAKMMAVKGHTVSQVSARWTGNVVYAIFTSASEKYHDGLLAELGTWAEVPARQGRFVAVGGSNYPDEWQTKNVLKSECGDSMESISCKEATLLAEGAARGADWLYVIGEDNYVHTKRIEEFLSDKDPDSVIAYGTVGCGKGIYCTDDDGFTEEGGFCGGGGYIISRGALQRLLANGAPELHEIYDATPWPNDMTTSCQLRKHEVVLSNVGNMYGFPIVDIDDYKGMARGDFLTLHYLRPATMRWFHAHLHGASKHVTHSLEEAAFDHGCAKDIGGVSSQQRFRECLVKKGATPQ